MPARLRSLLLLAAAASCAAAAGPGCRSAPPPPPHEAHLERGEEALALGELDAAAAEYQAALELESTSLRAFRGLGRTRLAEGDAEEALRVLRQASELHPRRFELEVRPDYCAALVEVIAARTASGSSQAALALVRDPLTAGCADERTGAASVGALLARARELAAAGEFAAAQPLYEEIWLRAPERPAGAIGAASIMLRRGQTDSAIAMLSQALGRHPDDRRLQELMVRALSAR